MPPRGKAIKPSHPVTENSIISSGANRWLKEFRAGLAGESTFQGSVTGTVAGPVVGCEGVRLVEAALGCGLPVEALLVSTSGERHLGRLGPLIPSDLKVLHTTDRLFAGVTGTEAPQGVAALVRLRPTTLAEVARGTALVVVLAGIQDPGNVGTILRSAEAFGATGSVVCAVGDLGTANPWAPKALRASAGSALRLPILRVPSAAEALAQLNGAGLRLYAAVADADRSIARGPVPHPAYPWSIDWKQPSALVIGNEGAGLPEEIVRMADVRVSIPQSRSARSAQSGGVDSLNAAMAATVLLYEAMRQRQNPAQL